jgi:N-formylglutamate amidohydrolase
MSELKKFFESISPVLIEPDWTSVKIGLSKRWFVFEMMRKLADMIEEDPHLNFIALLKQYKILGNFLTGTVHEFYRDRNRSYFENFFADKELYRLVKKDLQMLHKRHAKVRMTITKRGLIVYDNYKKGSFNVLLLTMHSGTWVPSEIERKLRIRQPERVKDEDVGTHLLYGGLVLDKAGIWIDNKQSRFVVDMNRPQSKAIYDDYSEKWLKEVWKERLTDDEKELIYAGYREFYFTLARLVETHGFNIILDGHSMKDMAGRPNISFGTRYIPKFYMPIVINMQRKMSELGYDPVKLDVPYYGGNVLRWLNVKFPNAFICSMEINKRLYMKENLEVLEGKSARLSHDLMRIFDF